MGAEPGMQRHAPPAKTVCVDQRMHLAIDSSLRKRRDDKTAFPCLVRPGLPMLDGTAAADPEMLAERFNTLRAWLLDVHQPSSVGMMTDHRFDLGNFATQRERHVDRL